MENELTLSVTDLDINGYGIAHSGDQTYFIENALPQEEIIAIPLYKRNKIIYCKNKKILKESDLRTNPLCKYYFTCGGCNMQHLVYEETLKFKQNLVKNTFKKVAGIDISVLPCESSKGYFYRNKMAMPVRSKNGVAKLCMFKKNSHDPAFIDHCLIQNEKFEKLILIVNDFLSENNVKAYNEKTFKGDLKFVVARIVENKLLLTFVVTKKLNANFEKLYSSLTKIFTEVSLSYNINTLKNNVILTDNLINIYGKNYISINQMGFNFKIDNLSFLQINEEIQSKIYLDILKEVENNVVVNAYSGAGLLSAIVSKTAKFVYGLEIVQSASKSADKLKKENNINNMQNICGDAGLELEKLSKKLNQYTLIVDPPRKGLNDDMLNAILKSLPQKIIYVSCNPIGLAKNINVLKEKYAISSVKSFDMFPQTTNVETLVVLNKIN